MELWIFTSIIGAVAGGYASYRKVSALNGEVRAHPCPGCGVALGIRKPGPRAYRHVMWGGWICPGCGCDVDRHGKVRGG